MAWKIRGPINILCTAKKKKRIYKPKSPICLWHARHSQHPWLLQTSHISRICGKIKKSNVLHYICHFTSDKNNFLYSWLFFSLTWAENEHWQPLYGHLRLSNFSFPVLVTPENNHSYQKLIPSLGEWKMDEVKYFSKIEQAKLYSSLSKKKQQQKLFLTFGF